MSYILDEMNSFDSFYEIITDTPLKLRNLLLVMRNLTEISVKIEMELISLSGTREIK